MIGWLKAVFGAGDEEVGPQEAVRRMNQGALLVDVREPGEFAGGHAPGALSVPLGRVRGQGAAAIDGLGPSADVQEILLVCHSGMRSRTARSALASDARRRYVNVSGGMAAWAAAGLPVLRGEDAR